MKYFLHDSNAFSDEKITLLYMKYGYEGLGLFYTALEKFAAQEKPIKTDVLKSQLKIGKRLNKCWLFMEEMGIISSSNGDSFSKELLNFSQKYQIKKQKTAERVAEWRRKHDNVTSYEPVTNAPKVKLSKVKLSKEDTKPLFSFEFLWSKYPNKDGRRAAEKSFSASVKTEQDWKDINKALENYLKSEKVFKGFVKNGSTWFGNWRDWIDYKEPIKTEFYKDKESGRLNTPQVIKKPDSNCSLCGGIGKRYPNPNDKTIIVSCGCWK